jgi:hypothetical protein
LLVLAGLAVAAASCKEGPQAGDLSVNLTTPNSDDGAMQFTATATSPTTITGLSGACANCKLFIVKVSDTQYKGVVTGTIVSGTLFKLSVSDTRTPSSYSVTVDAASSQSYVLRSGSGYSVTLR